MSGAAPSSEQAAPPVPRELAAAIEECLLRASHLQSQLGPDHPPADARLPEAIGHYGEPNDAFQRWAAWAAIERLRRKWRALAPAPAGMRPSNAFAGEAPAPAKDRLR